MSRLEEVDEELQRALSPAMREILELLQALRNEEGDGLREETEAESPED